MKKYLSFGFVSSVSVLAIVLAPCFVKAAEEQSVPVQPVSCPADTVQHFVETVAVPANSSTATMSSNSLTNGANYFLKARGTANGGDGITFDARYSIRVPSSPTTWTDLVSTYEDHGPSELDLLVNGSTPWGDYNSSHEYSYLTTGNGSPASFLVNDYYYENSSGNLSVDIYSCDNTVITPNSSGGGGGGYVLLKTEIPGCGTRTTGFSTITSQSCVNNIPHSEGQVLGAEHFNFTLLLKMGSHGNEVTELQKFLNTAGYGPLVADGNFGPKTKAALIKFQLANGLKGDGIVGPLTRAVLNK